MIVSILMTILVLLMFGGIPLLHFLEKRTIRKQTGEKILIEVKEKTKKMKVALYIVFAALVLFVLRAEEVTFYLGTLKVMFIVGVYFMEAKMKTRLYLTEKGIYMVERLRNKQFIHMVKFKKGQVYKIDLVPNLKGVYRLYFSGTDQYATTLDIKFSKKEEVAQFRKVTKEHFELYINEPFVLESYGPTLKQPRRLAVDRLTKGFLWIAFLFVGIALIKESAYPSDGMEGLERILTAIVALQFIPFLVYLFSYIFMQVSGKYKMLNFSKLKKRHVFLLYMIGSALLPFVVLLNHGQVDGTRYIIVHLLGIFMIGLAMVTAWLLGKTVKIAQDKHLGERVNRMIPARLKELKK